MTREREDARIHDLNEASEPTLVDSMSQLAPRGNCRVKIIYPRVPLVPTSGLWVSAGTNLARLLRTLIEELGEEDLKLEVWDPVCPHERRRR